MSTSELSKALEGLNTIKYEPLLHKVDTIESHSDVKSVDDAIQRQQKAETDRSAATVAAMQERHLKNQKGNQVEELIKTLNQQKQDTSIRQERAAKLAVKRLLYLPKEDKGIVTQNELLKKGELSLIDQLRGLPKDATIESVRAIVEMEQNELVLKKHAFSPDASAAEIIEILGEGNPALNYVRSDFSGAVELGKRFPGIYALALSGGHRTFFDKDESADAAKLAQLFPDGITMQEALNNPKLMYKGVPLSRIILEEMMAENFLLGGGHRLSEHAINNGYIPAVSEFINTTLRNNEQKLAEQVKAFSEANADRDILIAFTGTGNSAAAYISNPNGGLIQQEMVLSGNDFAQAALAVGIRIEQLADDDKLDYADLTRIINGKYFKKGVKGLVGLEEFSKELHEKLISIREKKASGTLGGLGKMNSQLNESLTQIFAADGITPTLNKNNIKVYDLTENEEYAYVQKLRAEIEEGRGTIYPEDYYPTDADLFKIVDARITTVKEADANFLFEKVKDALENNKLSLAETYAKQITRSSPLRKQATDLVKESRDLIYTVRRDLDVSTRIQTVLTGSAGALLDEKGSGAKAQFGTEAVQIFEDTYFKNVDKIGDEGARIAASQALDRFLNTANIQAWQYQAVVDTDSQTDRSNWEKSLIASFKTDGVLDKKKLDKWISGPLSQQEIEELKLWETKGIFPNIYSEIKEQGMVLSKYDLLRQRLELYKGNATVVEARLNNLSETKTGDEAKAGDETGDGTGDGTGDETIDVNEIIAERNRKIERVSQNLSTAKTLLALNDNPLQKNNPHGPPQSLIHGTTGYIDFRPYATDGKTLTLGDYLAFADNPDFDESTLFGGLLNKNQIKIIQDSGILDGEDLNVQLDDAHINQMQVYLLKKLKAQNKEVNGALLAKTFKAFSLNELPIIQRFYESEIGQADISEWNQVVNLDPILLARKAGLINLEDTVRERTPLKENITLFPSSPFSTSTQALSYPAVDRNSPEYSSAVNNIDQILAYNNLNALSNDVKRDLNTQAPYQLGELEKVIGSDALIALKEKAIENSRKEGGGTTKQELMKLVLKLPEFKGAKQRYKQSIITRVIDSGVLNLDRNISFDISDIKNKDMIFLFGKKEWEKIKTGAWASVAVDKDRNIFTDNSILYNKYLIHGLRKSAIFQSFLKKEDKK